MGLYTIGIWKVTNPKPLKPIEVILMHTCRSLSKEASKELKWWIANVENAFNVVSHDKPQYTITIDASLLGWGAVLDDISTGGNWTYDESVHHINYLEMYAILMALKTFANDKSNTHIRIITDNSTAVSAINHMGTSHSHSWERCLERNIWISVAHIPSTQFCGRL